MEDEDNALFVILELFFYPLRVILYKIFCEVTPQKKILASTVLPGEEENEDEEDEDDNDNDDDAKAKEAEEAERKRKAAAAALDSEDTIDGFPIDCGTKQRKFLSMVSPETNHFAAMTLW